MPIMGLDSSISVTFCLKNIRSSNNNAPVWSLVPVLHNGIKINMWMNICQNGRSVGCECCRQKMMMLCDAFILGGLLDSLEHTEDVVLQCLRLRLLDEFIVGYIVERKLQRLLIGLRLHAGCRQDNE